MRTCAKFYDGEFYEKERPDYFTRAESDKGLVDAALRPLFRAAGSACAGPSPARHRVGPPVSSWRPDNAAGGTCSGFEPSRLAAQYTTGRGIAVVNDFFTPGKAQQHGPFDVVSLNLVLEHLSDPIALVQDAKRMLNPGGILFVTSPNDFNPLQMLLWEKMGFKPWWIAPRHHLNYFDLASVRRLFREQGLEPVHLETSYPLENFILSGRNYVGDDTVGRACHAERKAFETALFTHDPAQLRALAASWAAQGIGREFVILGRTG